MIKVTSIEKVDAETNSYRVGLFADTKDEVVSGAEIKGLPAGATIEMGSILRTAKFEMASMKSNGEWEWA